MYIIDTLKRVLHYVFKDSETRSFWARLDPEKRIKRNLPCQDCIGEGLGRRCREVVRDYSCRTLVADVTFRGRTTVNLDLSEHFHAVGVKWTVHLQSFESFVNLTVQRNRGLPL